MGEGEQVKKEHSQLTDKGFRMGQIMHFGHAVSFDL
jgi:hypothetical protein